MSIDPGWFLMADDHPHLTIEDIDATIRTLGILRRITLAEQYELALAYRLVITEVHTIARNARDSHASSHD